MGLKKSNFGSKSNVISLRFCQKIPVCGKTDQISIFPFRETYILDWLYIMVRYINLYMFLKKLNFGSKSKGVRLRFYRKCQFATKTSQNSVFLGCEA
jgi:hypothetical protein